MNITPQAAQAINQLVSGHPGAGLRIASRAPSPGGGQPELAVSVVQSPVDSDQRVEDNGAEVFLEDRVAPLLRDKTLDLGRPGGTEKVLFQLVP